MAYLKRLPVSMIKIDRVFIADIDAAEDGQMLVSMIIGLAHSLGLDVIAEGVERSEQATFLRSLGCDHAQGYLYHHPMPADEFAELLEANKSRHSVPT